MEFLMENGRELPLFHDAEIEKAQPAANSTGVMLSTLWSQFGILDLGNNTTVTCDHYTPIDTRTGEHSVTGCTNTAAAQIIYYFIEKQNLALTLTLNSEDAYLSHHSSGLEISVNSDGSTPGTISFAAVNSKLGSYDLNSADDAAALLYACGVIQQAGYSSNSTSTAWEENLFYRAGFASVRCSRYYEMSGNEYWLKRFYYWGSFSVKNGQYTYTISDGAWEVVIENLLAGRVVGASIPGHAVVIDGYDSGTGKFHINYGWGAYSSGTRWYSRSELHDLQIREFVYDLMVSGIENLTVSDSRLYGTGTLLRAFEQALSIKGKNTISFDTGIAGNSLCLSDAISLADKITVDGFNMNIYVTDSLSSWGIGFRGESESDVRFRDFSGSLISNTKSDTNCAFYLKESKNASVELNGGLVFAGSYTETGDYLAGSRKVLSSLQSSSLYGASLPKFILDAASGDYAFYSTSGSDILSLDNNSVVVGNISMGAGDDILEIRRESACYGYIWQGAGDNTICIDSSSTLTGLIYDTCDINFVLEGEAADRAIFNVKENAVNITYYADSVTVDITGAESGIYTLFAGDPSVTGMEVLKGLSVTVTGAIGKDYILQAGSTGQSVGETRLFYSDYALKLEVELQPITQLSGSASSLKWTGVTGGEDYEILLTADHDRGSVSLGTRGEAVDLYGLPEGDWEWGVRRDGKINYQQGNGFHSAGVGAGAVKYDSDRDCRTDLFFANPAEIWGKGYAAEHTGMDKWAGTGEKVLLAGKNRFQDIFNGSEGDYGIIMLTDDARGDALFSDDIYSKSASGLQEERIVLINEIYAGAGDDIVDLTTVNFQEGKRNGIEIRGGDGNDVIWSGTGTSYLYGDAGNDRITGGTSSDVIIGGAGDDVMCGGGGTDNFYFGVNWGNDVVSQVNSGKVLLWFEEGDESCWDAEKRIYSDGNDSVTVLPGCQVQLKFGHSDANPESCFASASSSVIYRS